MIIDDVERKRVPKKVSETFDKNDYLVQIHNKNLAHDDGSLAPLTYMVIWFSLENKSLVTSGNYSYVREKDYNEYVKKNVLPTIKLSSKLVKLETKDKDAEEKIEGFLNKQVYMLTPNDEIHSWWKTIFTDKEKFVKLGKTSAVINKEYFESEIRDFESYIKRRDSKIGVQ